MSIMDAIIETPEQIRARILEAAQRRFEQFGFNKTTMAEVAQDCKMSAANLYRYFENKQDIGAQLACRCLGEEEAILREVVSRREQSAAARLRAFVLEMLHRTYQTWSERPRIDEMVEAICKERTDVIEQHRAAKRRLLVALLAEGNASGEFDVPDPAKAADGILTATVMFDVPLFMHMSPLADFEQHAQNLSELVLRGLLKH